MKKGPEGVEQIPLVSENAVKTNRHKCTTKYLITMFTILGYFHADIKI